MILTVSGLCLRAQGEVLELNNRVEQICSGASCTFMRSYSIFYLQDGTINDGFLDQKGLHLNSSGMKRHIEKLAVSGVFTCADGKQSRPKSSQSHIQHGSPKSKWQGSVPTYSEVVTDKTGRFTSLQQHNIDNSHKVTTSSSGYKADSNRQSSRHKECHILCWRT